MSGLIPRNQPSSGSGSFTDLTVQSLTVSAVGFINNLIANTISVTSLVLGSITTTIINGNPGVNIIATPAQVNGATILSVSNTASVTNKSLVDNSTSIVDNTDATKKIIFDAGGTTGTSTTLAGVQASNIIVTLPNITDTLVGRQTTDSLHNKSLVCDSTNFWTDAVDSSKKIGFSTTPASTGTIVLLQSAATSSRTITFPDATDTLVGKNTVDILTNKTINSASNTLTITNSPLSNTNINSLINQDVRTTASPTFNSLSFTNGISEFGGTVADFSGSFVQSGVTNVTAYTLSTTSNHAYMVDFSVTAYVTSVTSGTDLGKTFFQKTISGVTNTGGTVTLNATFQNSFATNSISGGIAIASSGTSALFQFGGNATDTMRVMWYVKVYSN